MSRTERSDYEEIDYTEDAVFDRKGEKDSLIVPVGERTPQTEKSKHPVIRGPTTERRREESTRNNHPRSPSFQRRRSQPYQKNHRENNYYRYSHGGRRDYRDNQGRDYRDNQGRDYRDRSNGYRREAERERPASSSASEATQTIVTVSSPLPTRTLSNPPTTGSTSVISSLPSRTVTDVSLTAERENTASRLLSIAETCERLTLADVAVSHPHCTWEEIREAFKTDIPLLREKCKAHTRIGPKKLMQREVLRRRLSSVV